MLTMESMAKSLIWTKESASASKRTAPLSRRLRSSKSECKDRVATCGLDHRLPPSSTSSSNLTQLLQSTANVDDYSWYSIKPQYRAVSFHSVSPSWLKQSSSISEKSGWDSWVSPSSPSACSSPRINWTRCEGGIAATKEITKIDFSGYKSYEWSGVQLLYNTIIRYGRFFCNPGLVVTVTTVVTVMGSPFTPARRSTAAAAGKVDSNVHGVSSMPCIIYNNNTQKKTST